MVDAGTARISRYSARLKVQRLPIEAVSQASADQRAGRCGRVADGICIRLYDEEDFTDRPEFTDPEILRTNLASVILAMTDIGLGDVAAFPFIDPPDARAVTDGVRLLQELGALEVGPPERALRLTRVGRRLARLPIDPRFGRMVLEAEGNGCLREVLIIAAGLSIQDPRERPADHAPAADQAHARFADETSDFLAYVKLWQLRARAAARPVVGTVPAPVPPRVPELPAGAGVAGRPRPAAPRGRRPGDGPEHRAGRSRPRAPLAAGRAAVPPGPEAARVAGVPGRPQRPLRHLPRLGPGQAVSPTGSWPPSWWRPRACGAAPWPASNPSGPRRWPATWSSAATASRTGRPSGRRPWPTSG